MSPRLALQLLGACGLAAWFPPVSALTARQAAGAQSELSAGQGTGDNLFVYRDHAEPTAFSTGIIVDGRKIVGLPNRHYTSIRLPPGTHSVTVDWPPLSGQDDATIQVQINGNEAHFVEVLGTYRFAGIGYHRTYFRVGSGVAEALPEPGRQAVQTCCKFKAPK